jgi:hypothetical protein
VVAKDAFQHPIVDTPAPYSKELPGPRGYRARAENPYISSKFLKLIIIKKKMN